MVKRLQTELKCAVVVLPAPSGNNGDDMDGFGECSAAVAHAVLPADGAELINH